MVVDECMNKQISEFVLILPSFCYLYGEFDTWNSSHLLPYLQGVATAIAPHVQIGRFFTQDALLQRDFVFPQGLLLVRWICKPMEPLQARYILIKISLINRQKNNGKIDTWLDHFHCLICVFMCIFLAFKVRRIFYTLNTTIYKTFILLCKSAESIGTVSYLLIQMLTGKGRKRLM